MSATTAATSRHRVPAWVAELFVLTARLLGALFI